MCQVNCTQVVISAVKLTKMKLLSEPNDCNVGRTEVVQFDP